MRQNVRKTMLEGLLALIFIGMISGCATRPMSSAPKSLPALGTEAESEPAVQSTIPALNKPISSTPKSPPATATRAEAKPTVQSTIPVLRKPLPSEQRPEFYVHEIRWTGETLSSIAKWYTGNQNNWEHIVKVNPGLDPMRMKIGDKILIPLALLKTRESMPQKYLGTVARKKDTPSTPRVKPAIESDKEEVVGASKTDRLEAKVDKINHSQPKDTELSAEKLDEIELFQPQNIEQIAAESKEVELFQPIE